ncbi:MAG: GNAT family N-acetyltransferase [Armatimonadota bacterium]
MHGDFLLMVRDGSPPEVPTPLGVTLAHGSTNLLLELGDVTPDTLQTRLSRQDRAFVALAGGRPAAVLWVHLGDFDLWGARSRIALPPSRAMVYGVYTAPAWQRRGISSWLERRAFQEMELGGVLGGVCVVEPDNRAGLARAHRTGYREFLRLRYLRVLGIGAHIVSSRKGRTRVRVSLAGMSGPLQLALG